MGNTQIYGRPKGASKKHPHGRGEYLDPLKEAEAAKETASNFIATQAQNKLEKGDGQVDAELKKDVKDMKENVEDIKEVKDDVASIKETLNLLTIALNEKNGVLDDKAEETKSLGDTEEAQKSLAPGCDDVTVIKKETDLIMKFPEPGSFHSGTFQKFRGLL